MQGRIWRPFARQGIAPSSAIADGEGADQPTFVEIATAAREQGIAACYLPVETGKVSDDDYTKFGELTRKLDKPVLAYCRTGMRAATLWGLSDASSRPLPEVPGAARVAGYELGAITLRIANGGKLPVQVTAASHEIVIIGASAAGLAVAASLLARDESLDIVVIDPAEMHYYQPRWTMVGGGVFRPETTARETCPVKHHLTNPTPPRPCHCPSSPTRQPT